MVLDAQHREELVADWLRVYGVVWRPLHLVEWLRGERTRGNLGVGAAWRMTRAIMRDHERSLTWAMLTGGWRIAPASEQMFWDEAAAAKRIKKGATWRPWLDPHMDPLREVLVKRSSATDRAALKSQFNIED